MDVKSGKAGWSIKEYGPLVDIGRTLYYSMPPDQRPRSVKVGRRTIIIEPPQEYLHRLLVNQSSGK